MVNVAVWLGRAGAGMVARIRERFRRMGTCLAEESGQGTTEYAVLVGVLVIIAIFAILVLREPITNLWQGIIDNMTTLSETSAENPFG